MNERSTAMKTAVMLGLLAGLLAGSAWADAPPLLTIWGSRGIEPGHFEHPSGVAVDGDGYVYVADFAASRVQVLTSAGAFVRQFNPPPGDTLHAPSKVALGADGTIYVADGSACGISMWKDGVYLGWFGGCGGGPGLWAYSFGVAVKGDRVYVSDTMGYRIEVFTASGQYLAQFPTGDACEGLAVDAGGNIFVAEYGGRVDVFTPGGSRVSSIGAPGGGPGQLDNPYDVALDGMGHVYVADAYNHRIEVFTTAGDYVTDWGTRGSEPGQFIQPRGVAVGPDGRIFVADTWNDRIQVFGSLPTPVKSSSWGGVKARYR
jgi:DNA-binding beta-propeller fold protein YncE